MRNASGCELNLTRGPTRRTLWPACDAHPRTRPETSGEPWPPRSQDRDWTDGSINRARYHWVRRPPKRRKRRRIRRRPPPLRDHDPKGRCRFSKSIKITLMRAHHAGDALGAGGGWGAWAPPGLGGPQGPVGVAFSEAGLLMPGPTYHRPGGAARILRHFCFSSARWALARSVIPPPRCQMPCPRMIATSRVLRSCPARSRTGSPGQQPGSQTGQISSCLAESISGKSAACHLARHVSLV